MNLGVVKRWVSERGYGFIKPDDGGADVFLHVTIAERAGLEIAEGDRLRFETMPGRDGKPRALSIERA